MKITLLIINFQLILLFLLACLIPWLDSQYFWPVAFIGLAVPYLIILIIFFILLWLSFKPRLALFSAIVLLVGYKQIIVVLALHSNTPFDKTKKGNAIRIIDWNVHSFNGLSKDNETKRLVRNEVVSSISNYNPDIICLQEFNHSADSLKGDNNISLFSNKYPYYFFSKDYSNKKNKYQSGCIIFSKYPVINYGKTKFKVAESLIYIDVVKGDDTVRIYTTHLQSYKFEKGDYDEIEKIEEEDKQALAGSTSLIRKMGLAFKRRGNQANVVREETAKSPYPSVICGDFNEVPNSYVYFRIRGSRQDVFLKKDLGIGKSFISLAPSLRIDYILPDNNFDVLQFDLVDENLSDHLMLVTDVKLK